VLTTNDSDENRSRGPRSGCFPTRRAVSQDATGDSMARLLYFCRYPLHSTRLSAAYGRLEHGCNITM
jgi:hypothetical protein